LQGDSPLDPKTNRMENSKEKQNAGGRPALGNSKKQFYVTASFTKDEHEELVNKAEVANVKLAVLVSKLAIKGKVIPRYSVEEKEIIKGIVALNNNLNQLAKNLNYFVNNFNQKEVNKQVIRIDELLDTIDNILK
jgi:hypothetical protein